MKKLIAIILVLSLACVAVACGGGASSTAPASSTAAASSAPASSEAAPAEASGNAVPDGASAYANSRIAEFYAQYGKGMHLKMRTTAEGQTVDMDSYNKDNKTCVAMVINGESARVVSDMEYSYTIMDSSAMVMKTALDTDDSMDLNKYEVEPDETIESGTEQYNGETFDFERVVEKDETSDPTEGEKFYFTKGTSTLRYIISDEDIIEIVSYDSNIPADIFDIPSDYEVWDMNAAAGGAGGAGGTGNMDLSQYGIDAEELGDVDVSDFTDLDLSAYGVDLG